MVRQDKMMERADELTAQMTLLELVQQISVFTPDNSNPRLGIPHINVGEACHGVCIERATSFPQAIAMGATFHPKLIRQVGEAVAKEARAYKMHMVFAPMLGLARDARWGRVEESFGEDPVLVSEIGSAYIEGMQGTGEKQYDSEHVMCVAKHFIADGEPLKGINGAPVDISEAALRELHLKPFEKAVKEAGLGGIMPAHHSVNRVPCHCNEWLLQNILRNEWEFDGVVVSDMLDIPKIYSYEVEADDRDFHQHRVAQNWPEASWMALKAGVDVELGGYHTPFSDRSYGQALYEGILSGKFPEGEKHLRRAARNIILAKMRLGLFENQEGEKSVTEGQTAYSGSEEGEYYAVAMKHGRRLPGTERLMPPEQVTGIDFAAHDRLAQKVAEESIILLKNEGVLPLKREKLRRIAVIGPNADRCLLGGYSTREPRHYRSVLEGIRSVAGDHITVTYSKGCEISKYDNEYGAEWEERRAEYIRDIPQAVEDARQADIAVLVLGHDRSICGENTDADEISLTWAQRQLVRAVYQSGTPVVLILIGGRPTAIPWENEKLPAILQCFYPGQETGTAVANVLFGKVNPSGKLPMAVPRRSSHIPVLYNTLYYGSPKSYIGTDMPCTPLYPFGYGLSYTTFTFRDLRIDRAEMHADESALVQVTVANTGKMEGAEVVQFYIRDDFGSIVRPLRELKHFEKVFLAPGEEKTVMFRIGFEELKFFKDGKWIVEPGDFSIYVGNDSTCMEKVMLRVTDMGMKKL